MLKDILQDYLNLISLYLVPMRPPLLQRAQWLPHPLPSSSSTNQMLHLVVWLAVLQVCKVGHVVSGLTKQLMIHSRQGVVEHVSGLHIMFGGHQPRLEQVLVETVSQCTNRDVLYEVTIIISTYLAPKSEVYI